MSNMFEYDDIVRVRVGANVAAPARAKAWVVGITEADKRNGAYYDRFPPGNVYTVEFEDGSSIDVHEKDLEPAQDDQHNDPHRRSNKSPPAS